MRDRLRYLPFVVLLACATAALHVVANVIAVHRYPWHTGMHYVGTAHQVRSFVAAAAVVLLSLGLGNSRITKAGAAVVSGGALANAISPFIWGGVPDYFLLHATGESTRLFNTADAALCFGVGLMVIGTVKWVVWDTGRKGLDEDSENAG